MFFAAAWLGAVSSASPFRTSSVGCSIPLVASSRGPVVAQRFLRPYPMVGADRGRVPPVTAAPRRGEVL
jgi:hypothetical protein